MGIVYTHGKHVASFMKLDGQPYYIGFEKVSLSNLAPRIPTWECSFMGGIEDALQWIFRTAASCVSGQLKGSGSRELKPENYIAGWLRELANPSEYPESEIVVSRSYDWERDSYADTKEKIRAALSGLESETADAVYAHLEMGERVSLSLHADIDLINALYGLHGPLRPAQIINSHHPECEHQRHPELGYCPRKGKASVDPSLRYKRFGTFTDDLLVQDATGAWRHAGAAFMVMAEFVASLYQQELTEPGTYKHHIANYRLCVNSAEPVVANRNIIAVEFDMAEPRKSWEKSSVDRVLEDYPHTLSGSIARLSVPMQEQDVRRVIHATKATATWILDH